MHTRHCPRRPRRLPRTHHARAAPAKRADRPLWRAPGRISSIVSSAEAEEELLLGCSCRVSTEISGKETAGKGGRREDAAGAIFLFPHFLCVERTVLLFLTHRSRVALSDVLALLRLDDAPSLDAPSLDKSARPQLRTVEVQCRSFSISLAIAAERFESVCVAIENARIRSQNLETAGAEGSADVKIETCHLTRAQMAQRLPRFVANVGRVFAEWERSGLAAEAGLGSGMALAEVGTARPIWVTTDATFRRLVGEGVEPKVATARAARRYEGGRSSSNWHVDSSGGDGYHGHTHRMWTLLHKRGGEGANAHGNLCVVPTAAVDACDSPRFRSAVGRGAMDVFDRLACCPHLDVGDTIFYREDVIHGTQDKLVDRLGMSITISGDGPRPLRDGEPAPEDPRCAAWAADGLCTPSTAVPVAAAASSSPAVSVGDRMGSAEDHVGMLVRCLCERSCGAMSTAT